MESIDDYQHICQIRCPAKAILCGEHAVVYSKDAVAIAIGLFCKGLVTRKKKNGQKSSVFIQTSIEKQTVEINCILLEHLMERHQTSKKYSIEDYQNQLNSEGKTVFQQETKFYYTIHYKLSLFLKEEKIEMSSLFNSSYFDYKISMTSDIPIGKCLGSSAAFNTVLATYFFLITEKLNQQGLDSQDKNNINKISFLFESVEHGNPSGIDNFITVNGGAIVYNKQKDPKFKKLNISAINLKQHINLGIVDTGVEKNTKKAVQQVKKRISQDSKFGQMIDQIGNITGKIIELLQNPNFDASSINKLIILTKENHCLLKQLGVSHEEIEKIVQRLSSPKRSVKITGSGMGGCVIAISDKFCEVVPDLHLVSLEQQGLTIIYP